MVKLIVFILFSRVYLDNSRVGIGLWVIFVIRVKVVFYRFFFIVYRVKYKKFLSKWECYNYGILK